MTGYIDPTKDSYGKMMKLPKDEPIWMLNLLSFLEKAAYEDGTEASGAEAYSTYGQVSAPYFKKVGGKVVWMGKAECMVIGPEAERWDLCLVAEYPSAEAFGAMIKDPGYQAITFHRRAALQDSRLIRIKPSETGGLFS